MGSCTAGCHVARCVLVAKAPRGFPGSALIRWLNRLVVYDQDVVGTLVVRGVLCLLSL